MLRVFISHSAKGQAAKFLDALAAGLREDSHQVLLDRDGLEPGVDWRSRLNVWMGGCDAAIVVLSEDALTSNFVAYEASILSYRMSMDASFTLIPIVLRPVTYAAVEESPVGATDIHALQSAIEAEDDGTAITKVRDVLSQVAPAETPLDKTAQQLSALLVRVPDANKRAHMAALGVAIPPWIPGDDLAANLAMSMLGAGLKASVDFLRAVRGLYRGRGELEDVIDLLACSWVDYRSVMEIPRCARVHRAVSANAHDPSLARMYVVRAALEAKGLPPSDSWIFAPIDANAADLEELKRQVLTGLTVPFGVDDPDEVPEQIALKRENEEPVFVALPAEGLTAATLRALGDAFEGVVFFVLAGADPPARELHALALWLKPELEPGAEALFCETYGKKRPFLLQGHR